MRTATLICKAKNMSGDASLYKLSEPLEGNEYVVVSAISNMWGPETYIFPASPDGKVVDWGELPGSIKGSMNHAEALRSTGYEVAA